MSVRIDDVFAKCRVEDRAALIGYLPAGFPDPTLGKAAITTLVESGADIVEVGLPYSDPLMDGPVIQAAAETALAAGTNMRDVFAHVTADYAESRSRGLESNP